jgi:hypothetical protein
MLRGGRRDEGVPQFETVAPVICAEEFSCLPSDFGVDGHADQRVKQLAKRLMLFRPRPMP